MSDYLWDQEGEDAEVEGLEQQLAALAYDADPPTLPSTPAHLPPPSPPLPRVRPPRSRGAPWKFPLVMPVLLGAGLVLMGFGIAWVTLGRERAEVNRSWALAPIVVASADLSEGEVLTAAHLTQRSVPARFIPDSAVTPDATAALLGHRLRVAVAAGDPLLWSQLERGDAVQGLVAHLAGRARSLAISATGLSDDARTVDVVGRFDDPATHEPVDLTLLKGAPVLSPRRASPEVSVLVQPGQAALLESAQTVSAAPASTALDLEDPRAQALLQRLLARARDQAAARKTARTIELIRAR